RRPYCVLIPFGVAAPAPYSPKGLGVRGLLAVITDPLETALLPAYAGLSAVRGCARAGEGNEVSRRAAPGAPPGRRHVRRRPPRAAKRPGRDHPGAERVEPPTPDRAYATRRAAGAVRPPQ